MVLLSELAIPIIVSAVFVFIASSILHMVLQQWHRPDLDRLPDEEGVMSALRPFGLRPGNYAMPLVRSMADLKDPAFIAKQTSGPVAFLNVMPSGQYKMGKQLAQWFLYCVLVSIFAAYIAGRALGPGVPYLDVFRFAGTTAFAAYAMGGLQESIWWHRKWGTTIRHMIDGLIYALLTAGTLGWLWPSTIVINGG